MDESKKLAMLEEVLDMDPGTLKPDQVLKEMDEWDSLAALSVVVMVKDEFDRKLSGDAVRSFTTVQDILNVMQ
jgi:acyl carrier protein